MTAKMTRLRFLELALEGARMRRGVEQGTNAEVWAALDADVAYVKAKLMAELKRLHIKEANKPALARAMTKAVDCYDDPPGSEPVRRRVHVVGVTPLNYGKEYDPKTVEAKDGWEK